MIRETALRGTLSVGLGVSVLLWLDYTAPLPLVCGEGGGCELVKSSSYAAWFGIPTPAFGILYFAVALALSLSPRAPRWLALWSVGGALAALGFLGVQHFLLGTLCPYCVVADFSALLGGVLLWGRRAPAARPLGLGLSGVAALLAVLVPVLGWRAPETPQEEPLAASSLPEPLAREQRPGTVAVIAFVEPGCAVCASTDSRLREVAARYEGKVRVVRKLLGGIGAGRAAAQALCCAQQLGAGDEMAAALFSGPLPEEGALEELAASLGLEASLYRECLELRAAEQLAQDAADARELGVENLPVLWIGGERVEGHLSAEALEGCVSRALSAL